MFKLRFQMCLTASIFIQLSSPAEEYWRPCDLIVKDLAQLRLELFNVCNFKHNDTIKCSSSQDKLHTGFEPSYVEYQNGTNCSNTEQDDGNMTRSDGNKHTFCLKLHKINLIANYSYANVDKGKELKLFLSNNFYGFEANDKFIVKKLKLEFDLDSSKEMFELPQNCITEPNEHCVIFFKDKLINVTSNNTDLNAMLCKIRRLEVLPQELNSLEDIPNSQEIRINEYFNATPSWKIPDHWVELEKLELSGMQIRDTSVWNFKSVASTLKHLIIESNSLTKLSHEISKLTQLKILEIVSMKLAMITGLTLDTNLLTTLPALQKLKINCVSQISGPFPWLPELKIIDFSESELKELNPGLFKNVPNLLTLNLNQNILENLEGDIFSNFSTQTEIRVSQNRLKNIRLTNVTALILDLHNNSFETLDGAFISCNITNLDISSSAVQAWTSVQVFQGIQNLNLSLSNISVMTSYMVKSLNVLTNLKLLENPFDCRNCYFYEFQSWFQKNKAVSVESPDMMKCVQPEEQLGKSLLHVNPEDCDTDYGHIIGLPVAAFILITCTAIIVYLYRFEIAYIKHLWKLKKRSENRSTSEPTDREYDAFVSYCSDDRAWVWDVLVKTLECDIDLESSSEGQLEVTYRLCLHERDFRLGSYIFDNVVECIEKSRRVIFVLTPHFMKSGWCQWELRMAQQRLFEDRSNDFLIMLELERLNRDLLPSSLRFLMATRTYLEWPKQITSEAALSSFWKRMRDAMGTPLKQSGPSSHLQIEDLTMSDIKSQTELVSL